MEKQNKKKSYQNGKIYKIWSVCGDKVYIGSTTKKYLSQRMDSHRSQYKRWKSGKTNKTTSFELFDEYGIENCKMELIELSPCNTNDELTARESHYIRTLDCVNKYIPQRTKKEYNEDNKDKLSDKMKQYREDNKDKISEQNKQYYEDNKDKLSEQKKQLTLCQCGSTVRKDSLSRHFKTVKHEQFINQKPEESTTQ